MENPQVLRAVNLVIGELEGLLDRAVEIGADDVAVEIADDEQGRIQERFPVAEELPIGLVKVPPLALVFPGEAALLPDVGEAALFGGGLLSAFVEFKKLRVLDDSLLEAEEVGPGRVSLSGRGLAQKAAEIVEVLLVGGRLLATVSGPFPFELSSSHATSVDCAPV